MSESTESKHDRREVNRGEWLRDERGRPQGSVRLATNALWALTPSEEDEIMDELRDTAELSIRKILGRREQEVCR